LNPSPSLALSSSVSGDLLAHQTSQSAPTTGIFKTTSKKKIGSHPSMRAV
jgi:hypothetical protein